MPTTPILPHLDFRCRIVGEVSAEPPPRRGVGDARSPRCRYAQAVLAELRQDWVWILWGKSLSVLPSIP